MLADPLRTPADIYLSAWGKPTNRTCPWAGCNGNKLNSGFIFARATARTVGLLNRTLLLLQGRKELWGARVGKTIEPMYQRYTCNEQEYLGWQLHHDARRGLVRSFSAAFTPQHPLSQSHADPCRLRLSSRTTMRYR